MSRHVRQLSMLESEPFSLAVEDVHPGLARYGDPATSHAAAQKITGRTERLIVAVFRSHADGDGWTADEICAELPTLNEATVKSAISRVHRAGLIRATEETRLSRCGCAQTVYQLVAT